MKKAIVASTLLVWGPASAFQFAPRVGHGTSLTRLKSRSDRGFGKKEKKSMASKLEQAKSEQESSQVKPGWQDVALSADAETIKAQEERARQAAVDARAAGFDPEDEESMKQWRREVAQKARDRMAANAGSFKPRDIIVREEEESHLEAPAPRFAKREPEKYTPYDEDESFGADDEQVDPIFSQGGDQRDVSQNVRPRVKGPGGNAYPA